MLGPYDGYGLVPGILSETFVAEHDTSGLVYGSPHHVTLFPHAVIDGTATDTGNTGNTSVLRPGLIMARNSVSGKYVPYANGGSNETNIAKGILFTMGLQLNYDGSGTDRWLATLIVKGCVNPEACFISANSAGGIATTGAGLEVRKAFLYNITFSDDFGAFVPAAFGSR